MVMFEGNIVTCSRHDLPYTVGSTGLVVSSLEILNASVGGAWPSSRLPLVQHFVDVPYFPAELKTRNLINNWIYRYFLNSFSCISCTTQGGVNGRLRECHASLVPEHGHSLTFDGVWFILKLKPLAHCALVVTVADVSHVTFNIALFFPVPLFSLLSWLPRCSLRGWNKWILNYNYCKFY
jgi:hypothetical protein